MIATDGPSALALTIDLQPDAVLLDIHLPGMSGHEVAMRIREMPHLRDIVLVAVTGHGEESDRQCSMEAGFDHHGV